jgi:hypothetical protein
LVRQTQLIGAIQIMDQIFQTEEGNVGNCEMDTHADTCVAGANFLACEFNGITGKVIPFSNDYESTKNIPIVSAATASTNKETGETIILYFHQVLWYGKRLKHSLLNPNQLRHYRRSVCDDVTDKSRSFGINIDDEFVIPFAMTGTNIFFKSRVPTPWEMENCRVIIMMHDSTWDPTTVQISSVTSDYHSLHTVATLKANQKSP